MPTSVQKKLVVAAVIVVAAAAASLGTYYSTRTSIPKPVLGVFQGHLTTIGSLNFEVCVQKTSGGTTCGEVIASQEPRATLKTGELVDVIEVQYPFSGNHTNYSVDFVLLQS